MGDNFNPNQLEKESGLTLVNKEEKSSLGKTGRYKNYAVPVGSAVIEETNLENLLTILSKHYNVIKACGVTETLVTLTLMYTDQCNWEFSSVELRLLASMDISFSITCYKGDQ